MTDRTYSWREVENAEELGAEREREWCAKRVESWPGAIPTQAKQELAAAIRQRGQPEGWAAEETAVT